MKKVLMISYSFPPHGGSAVIRLTKFVKYLPQFNWIPYVLTVKDSFCVKDESLLDEISNKCKIIRTYHLDPRYIFRREIQYRNNIDNFKINDLLDNFKKLATKVVIPDNAISWLPLAVFKGLNVISKEKIDLIYSIGTPNSNHLIAYVLKRLTGKPWVADFKDPWIKRYSYKIVPPFSIIDRHFEKGVINFCDKCIAVADFIKEDFAKHIFPKTDDKFQIISNGFDEEDFDNIDAPQHTGRTNLCLTVSHVGSLLPETSPVYFFENICELINEGKVKSNELKLIFVGSLDKKSAHSPVFKRLRSLGVLEFHGFVPHKESVRYMLESNLLLLIIDKISGSKDIPTSKIFEYLASGRPILALTAPDSKAAELVTKTKSGYIAGLDDKIAIKKTLFEIFNKYKNNDLNIGQDKEALTQYKRELLTKRLAQIFDSIIMTR